MNEAVARDSGQWLDVDSTGVRRSGQTNAIRSHWRTGGGRPTD